PKPYVQVVRGDHVQHVDVTMGPRSEVGDQTLVSISGVPEGSTVISGTVGILREGTLVKRVTPVQGTR
ncbi:MAG TPA: efflux transporter periplasmic adaptor subunit, partial [Rhodoferax sp.]